MTKTFSPAYDKKIDGKRIATQMDVVRNHMLGFHVWWTLAELRESFGYPEASISAQLRHLRKERFGGYIVEKRRRVADKGTWEYRVKPKGQGELF